MKAKGKILNAIKNFGTPCIMTVIVKSYLKTFENDVTMNLHRLLEHLLERREQCSDFQVVF